VKNNKEFVPSPKKPKNKGKRKKCAQFGSEVTNRLEDINRVETPPKRQRMNDDKGWLPATATATPMVVD
jgi:hypothetical protein